ncbi:NAD(P)H-binding protein [Cyanobacterium stanieri LEGE 03274]|uniref:NAD(P)H-binding protein n=1 Tax=Cyanobacterium stanieri LEGE 03274 TaxID=1828756 RepID=A0ABR9V1X4_9CHRO|nr:NAD(P)H-binding protein [Cyanobacterium stanieri]MBE9221551.1 NAD(P)H-binding protein [Cyanobacterium stanieri LEGE 03274]
MKILSGDVLDLATVEKAVKHQDAVVCTLGSGHQLTGNVRSQGTQHIIKAMNKWGVSRFICQTTLGAGDSWSNLDFYWKYIMFGFILRNVFADHQKQEEIVKQSCLQWTIIRPGAFVKGDRTGKYRHGFSNQDKTSKLMISRGDVADFILKELATNYYLGQCPSLSY